MRTLARNFVVSNECGKTLDIFKRGIERGTKAWANNYENRKMIIQEIPINYVEIGEGRKTLLCLPGLVGSVETDFKPIFQHMNQRKFKIVAWDPPGYGQSRPFPRKHEGNFYEKDAHLVMQLMSELGYEKFSMLGWSNGGMTGYTAAALYPSRIQKLVIWGTHAYFDERSIEFINFIRHLKNWSPEMVKSTLEVYDEKYLSELMDDWADSILKASIAHINTQFSQSISKVSCPTLVIHGMKDVVLGPEHTHFFQRHLKGCSTHILENAGHNLHLSRTREFLDLVEPFLLSENI